ncbi:MAG: hypothetical protein KBD15_02240 [Candidatus Magasanikbacteria bacterium]|jgi:hypothetical protein|nr:hypothetical protein [Candidatus Magasanikbacteria bacterium]
MDTSQTDQEQAWSRALQQAIQKTPQSGTDIDTKKTLLAKQLNAQKNVYLTLLQQKAKREDVEAQAHILTRLRCDQLSLDLEEQKNTLRRRLTAKDIAPLLQSYYDECYALVYSLAYDYGRKK